MRVQFDHGIDDMIDASTRALLGTRAGRHQLLATRTLDAAAIGFVAGLICGALVPGSVEAKLHLAMTVAAVVAIFYWVSYLGRVKRQWRRHFLDLLGSEGPFTCEVTLTPEGVLARQCGTQCLYEWPIVLSIEETGDSIDFRTRYGGYLVVRDRAFWSPGEREKFLATARRYHASHAGAGEMLPRSP